MKKRHHNKRNSHRDDNNGKVHVRPLSTCVQKNISLCFVIFCFTFYRRWILSECSHMVVSNIYTHSQCLLFLVNMPTNHGNSFKDVPFTIRVERAPLNRYRSAQIGLNCPGIIFTNCSQKLKSFQCVMTRLMKDKEMKNKNFFSIFFVLFEDQWSRWNERCARLNRSSFPSNILRYLPRVSRHLLLLTRHVALTQLSIKHSCQFCKVIENRLHLYSSLPCHMQCVWLKTTNIFMSLTSC